MALINDIDEYGFKRSEEEIKYLNESEHFAKITKRQIEWNNFNSSTIKNNVLFRSYNLKKIIRKGMCDSLFTHLHQLVKLFINYFRCSIKSS